MMLFDAEKYLAELENSKKIKQLKPPNNKVPPVNLPKLAFDKKIVPIVVSFLAVILSACRLILSSEISLC